MLKHILLAGVVVDGVGFDVRVRTFLILIRIWSSSDESCSISHGAPARHAAPGR